MDQSFIEKRINERADERLQEEYETLRNMVFSNPLAKHLEIGEHPLAKYGRDAILPESFVQALKETKSNLSEVLVLRKGQLVREETETLLRKLDGLQYLFQV